VVSPPPCTPLPPLTLARTHVPHFCLFHSLMCLTCTHVTTLAPTAQGCQGCGGRRHQDKADQRRKERQDSCGPRGQGTSYPAALQIDSRASLVPVLSCSSLFPCRSTSLIRFSTRVSARRCAHSLAPLPPTHTHNVCRSHGTTRRLTCLSR
jgi:hypothetical protein